MKMTMQRFRITNFRNIEDSGWVLFENVTAMVGRNESGKTALLQALYKFHPAIEEKYNPQREFPRDRFTADFHGDGRDFPVCQVEFLLNDEFSNELRPLFADGAPPKQAVCTRFYDGSLTLSYDTVIPDDELAPSELAASLDVFEKAVRRIKAATAEDEDAVTKARNDLLAWTTQKKDALNAYQSLRGDKPGQFLTQVRNEANGRSRPETAGAIETLLAKVDELVQRSKAPLLTQRLEKLITDALPQFIYFENYGILDSAVYLPRLLEDSKRIPHDARVRTINAMFKHVGLTAEEITQLGQERAAQARQQGQQVTEALIEADRENKELREIKLNSASLAITQKFNKWYGQRRHNIRYQADGDYFRIWVSDDKRPGMEIELESRSRGFQWFFSFYLVFLVESLEGHKDSILLLDEPGLHLHPTAQQELLAFFEELSANNPLIYTTHSPFLIDGEHLHRVRPMKEDDSGHSQISSDTWPEDRETIFPLQAAAGYAMVRGLFQHKKNVLVEGLADYLYLHSLNLALRALGRACLPDEVYITPCGGTKYMGYIASLFLGQKVRPVVLLDSDDSGRDRYKALVMELYAQHEEALLLLGDALGLAECETEDVLGEHILLKTLKEGLSISLSLADADRKSGSIVDQIKAAAQRMKVDLPDGWKSDVARLIVVEWSKQDPKDIPTEIIDRAERLLSALNQRLADDATSST